MSSFEELKSLFISNPSSAIAVSQKIICKVSGFDSYQKFFSYYLQNSHMSVCQKEWSKPQMSIHCFDCGVDPQSCICLQCFLNGHHEGHEYFVFNDSTGNCDCGDSSLWKQSGFCTEHQGLNENDNPQNYLDEKLRNTLTDIIFKAAFSSLESLKRENDHKVSLIFQFITSFLQFGDGFRRLIVISLTERIDFKRLLGHIFEYSTQFNEKLQQLCGCLINDQLFKVNFGIVNFELLQSCVIPYMLKRLIEGNINDTCSNWDDFWFQSFAFEPINTIILKHNWDWVTFSLNITKLLKSFFDFRGLVSVNSKIPSVFSDIANNIKFASQVQPNEETQKFFDLLVTTILNCGTKGSENENNTILATSFAEFHADDDDLYYDSYHIFYYIFYNSLQCFRLKKNLNLIKLFEELDKTIKINYLFCPNFNQFGDENDLFVKKFIQKVDDLSSLKKSFDHSISIPIENFFKSFHNGGSFFFSFPLFDTLTYMFKLDNMTRIKIAQILKLEKFKRLRIQLGIVALKKLNALICSHQSLVPLSNFSLLTFLDPITKSPAFINMGIPSVFPLFQLLIGLESQDTKSLNEFSIKEFFAFEMARELGIFDDFTAKDYADENINEKQKQMIFSFLYISLLTVIERTLFNYNGYYFMEEQIIFALKFGKTSPDQLADVFCVDSAREGKDHLDFNTILMKVAKTNEKEKNNKNGLSFQNVSFTLKDEIEWKTISAINPINNTKNLMNNEISKNPNSLIKIPEFEDEKTYFFHPSKEVKANPEEKDDEDNLDSSGLNIRLKEFLSTPTVLALVYHTLRMSGEKIELNDHLAMNILILVSKFVKEKDDSPSYDSSKEIIYDSSVIDLISKMKKILFSFKIEDDGSSSIQNTLNKRNFEIFLNMKIGSDTLEPKSFIEILIGKGELGKTVLKQMSIEFETNNDQSQKKSMKEINKQRASKLKESIISQYKTLINNYSTKSIESTEEQNNDDDDDIDDANVCSICSSTREDQFLSYPIYIYRTKFPFIVDKPPLVAIKEGSEFPVDEDEPFDEEENVFEQEEEEEEEENEEEEETHLFSKNRREIMKQLMKSLNSKKSSDVKPQKTTEIKEVQRRCTLGKNYVIQFTICPHPVHQICVNKEKFRCPVDRSFKNGFIPCLDSIPSNLICDKENVDKNNIQHLVRDSIICFINNFISVCKISPQNDKDLFVELTKSLSGLIATYEARLRSLPDCLDSNKTGILSRNLFLTIWYAYRISGKPKIDSESQKRLTLFQRFIFGLIECDQVEGIGKKNDAFEKIFSVFLNSENSFVEFDEKRKEKEIFLFLRRVCLSDLFLLNDQEKTKFIDWDDVLSVSSLSKRYSIELPHLKGKNENEEDFEFKPIVFTKLPKEFLRFALKPFNFPVEKTFDFSLYNILDYNYLIKNYDDFDDSVIFNENDLRSQIKLCSRREMNRLLKKFYSRKNYPSVFLLIGKFSSCIFVIDRNRMNVLKPFYLDRFGCFDVDYKRGQPLFLNEERYERTMDEIISGDFSNGLFPTSYIQNELH